jgi:hypothetical protein
VAGYTAAAPSAWRPPPAPHLHALTAPPMLGRGGAPASAAGYEKMANVAARYAAVPGVDRVRLRAATASAASDLRSILLNDTSDLALRPRDMGHLDALLQLTAEVAELGSPEATIKKDNHSWVMWSKHCDTLGTEPLRKGVKANSGADHDGHRRELFLLESFLILMHYTMTPRSRKDPKAKPASAMAHVTAVRRCHQRQGYTMAKATSVNRTLKGLLRLYVLAHGPESLTPRRKDPLTNEHTEAILSVPNGTVLGALVVDWESDLFVTFRALLTLLRHTGARKADLIPTTEDAFTRPLPSTLALAEMLPGAFIREADPSTARVSSGGGVPTRANISWQVGGQHYPELTPEQLHGLGPGDCAVFLPGGSKADFDATEFGARRVYLPFVDNIVNAAKSLARLELQLPVRGTQRLREPLLPASKRRQSLCHKTADMLFKLLATEALGATVAATLSLHSARVWLACALLAAGYSPSAIQAYCRWKSAESVKIYARTNPEDYAKTLLGVMDAEVTSISTHNLPTLDHDERFAALSDDLGDGASPAASTQPGAAASPEPRRANQRREPLPPPPARASPSRQPASTARTSPAPTERKRRAARASDEDTTRGLASRRRGHATTVVAASRR